MKDAVKDTVNDAVNDAERAVETTAAPTLAQRRSELEARLAALDTETDAQRDARQARELADLEALATAKETYGARRVGSVATDEGLIVVRRPHYAHFRAFMDDDAMKTKDTKKLVRACVVHPPLKRLEEVFQELPATIERVAREVMRLAGARTQDIEGK